MAENDFAEIELGNIPRPNLQEQYAGLLSTTLGVVGPAFKGQAFVPTVITNEDGADNTLINKLGTNRQNLNQHLYDEFLNYKNSQGYLAANAWLSNGGEYLYYTRVLGIGSGIKNDLTGKMKGSGFRVDQNVSHGTLDNTRSAYRFSNNDVAKGSTGFVLRKISQANYTEVNRNAEDEFSKQGELEYYKELGLENNDYYFITNVFVFNQGVLPTFDNSFNNTYTLGDIEGNESGDISNNNIIVKKVNTVITNIKLHGYNPLFVEKMHENTFSKFRNGFTLGNNTYENYKENSAFSDSRKSSNTFVSKFFEKGFLNYASFPLFKLKTQASSISDTKILISKSLSDNEKLTKTDYNSWESEYTTAKTPWVTSQPLDRSGFTESIAGVAYDNRINIHKKVSNLFKFFSLDDGEIGNRFRIKINIKKKGNENISDIRFVNKIYNNKILENYSFYSNSANAQSLINELDNFYATFDVHVFEYDPRLHKFIDLEDEAISAITSVQSFNDLNLNPLSSNYIGKVIGTKHRYYDFEADCVVEKGKYENTNKYIRVEISDFIEKIESAKQHMLLPSGFRSYPHIELNKESFDHYLDQQGNDEFENFDFNDMFDNNEIKHLPPMYNLCYLEDYTLPETFSIKNSWGPLFFNIKMKNQNNNLLNIHDIDRYSGSSSVEDAKLLSPHLYYTKYFLSDCKSEYQNVWKEEDNYLNSFFHLEKICTTFHINTNTRQTTSASAISEKRNINYKHSGKNLKPFNENSAAFYINLDDTESDTSIWKDDRTLNDLFVDRLSFDMFTYGGFDGVDIRDNDKRSFTNTAIAREVLGEDEKSPAEGATYNSYKKAIKIAYDDAYSDIDFFVVPDAFNTQITEQCTKLSDDSKKTLFIGDAKGALDNIRTLLFYDNNEVGANREIVNFYEQLGLNANYYDISSKISSSYSRNDSNLIINGIDATGDAKTPVFKSNDEDVISYENIAKSLNRQIADQWSTQSIQSKYSFIVHGNLDCTTNTDSFYMSPVVYTLAQFIKNSNSITESGNISLSGLDSINLNLIEGIELTKGTTENKQDFKYLERLSLDYKLNLLVKKTASSLFPTLNSQLLSHEVNKSIFTRQDILRSILVIKKRIKYDLFLNQRLVEGGFLFAQNSNSKNLNQLLKIQLDTLLSQFVSEGLIADFRVVTKNLSDPEAIIDMQSYILRGTVLLKFNTGFNNSIINLGLDSILSDLSLLNNESTDAVLIPTV